MDPNTAFILAQCISIGTGLVAIALKQMKTMKMILLFEAITNLLASTNYLLLGGDAGAIVSVLAIVHSTVMFLYNKDKKIPPVWITVVFIAAYTACSTYSLIAKADAMEILPAVGAACFALALTQKIPLRYRLWSVANSVVWMVYDGYNAAYVMLCVHFGILLSAVVALIRIDGFFNRKKKSN